ncbi:MAG: alpha/beta fold hydrolase [Alphaproteobacteria bacterium]|nr:alpha/beta fold hydrolase [Alphaproteobacteria bacterium]MBV8406607.1 alpha/beta fold hydrolase [Alphaproteobacteria bacterium]
MSNPTLAATAELAEQATNNTLAANPLVGVRGRDLFASLRTLLGRTARHPGLLAQQYVAFLGELGRIATGGSALAPDDKDKRFVDPAWKDNSAYRALAQSYFAWSQALLGLVDDRKLARRDAERARFVVSLFIDAMAPTNALAGNPAALKKLLDTGGGSLLHGLENFVRDLVKNGGLPAQVDTTKFAVGRNLATTPGSVVYRSRVMELIQYRPVTEAVHQRPLLIVPPQINKFYLFDLPGKSIVQFALQGGLQTFAISWKNPTERESHYGLETYITALGEAVDAVRAITGSEDVNVWGSCSGGITLSAFLASLAARNDKRVHSATVAVCVLDMGVAKGTIAGAFATRDTIAAAKASSRAAGVLEGRELARMFAWMRPNDLIWNYWVNNYLMGNPPPAFDVLYWNNDTTRLPARLHADFLDLISSDPFVQGGRLTVGGVPLYMRQIDLDSYVVAGTTDHITPWQGCYNTARLYGARSTFVLSNSGHIQSLLNPPGNPKAYFLSGPAKPASAEAWLEQATKQAGSWWPHWLEWIKARSGESIAAPAALGNERHEPLDPAPGRYVVER